MTSKRYSSGVSLNGTSAMLLLQCRGIALVHNVTCEVGVSSEKTSATRAASSPLVQPLVIKAYTRLAVCQSVGGGGR